MRPYRLGIDLGTNSIGWALLPLDKNGDPSSILDLGSRIFHDGRDPKSGESAAVQRRLARQARRTRDRKIRRKKKLLNLLTSYGFFPKDEKERHELKSLDPYVLRVLALENKLPPYHFGRAIYHLSQRRGFKSGRKTLSSGKESDENKKLIPKLQELGEKIKKSSSRTFGEYLAKNGKYKRNRPHQNESLHPTRKMIEDEFYKIVEKQKQFYAELLNEEFIKELHNSIFHQRPLKSMKEFVGPCELYPENEKRAPNYLPSTQTFKVLQTIGQLKIIINGKTQELTIKQKEMLYSLINEKSKESFEKIKIHLSLEPDSTFNLESELRKDLMGNPINAKLKGKHYFGKSWLKLDLIDQNKIVTDIEESEDEEELRAKAKSWPSELAIGEKIFLREILETLPKGYAQFSAKASYELCQAMLDHGFCRYDQARKILGHELGSDNPAEIKSHLPYYGEVLVKDSIPRPHNLQKNDQDKHGRIPNPTVHIALNQLRLVVNAIIDKYGLPQEVVVELTRDLKMNKEQKRNYEKQLRKNQESNEKAKAELAQLNLPANRENLMRYKIWEAQKIDGVSVCPYTGKTICVKSAFSQEFQIEHILPFSRTLDDSYSNKVLACSKANQTKRERSPFEAFGENNEILARVSKYPANKRWRFFEDAMERYKKENEWLARQLNDTKYMSKVAKRYLGHICPKVSVTKGILTGKIRYSLGLNSLLSEGGDKNRSDHRHHALDAVIIGLSSPRFLQAILKQSSNSSRNNYIIPEPWNDFRNSLQEKLESIIVSLKPDRSTQGAFFEETAYGVLSENLDGYNVTIRKNPDKITTKKVSTILDPQIKALAEKISGTNDKDFQSLFQQELNARGIYRVKVLEKKKPLYTINHPQRKQCFTKGYVSDQVHHLSVWQLPNGEWKTIGISVFDANRFSSDTELTNYLRSKKRNEEDRLHPAAKKVYKIHKGDYIRIPEGKKMGIWKIVSISPENKRFFIANPNISKDTNVNLMFSHLKKLRVQIMPQYLLGYKNSPNVND